jgi:hypothetical protein
MARGYKPPLTEVRRLPRDKTWWYINDIDTYNNDNRRLVRIKSPIQITKKKRENRMTIKTKKLKEQTVVSHGFRFVYTPSLHSMGVHYPNGRLSIFHCLYGEKWLEVVNQILTQHGSYKRK